MSLSSGTKLGRYEIRSKIGEGGMGEVYLAKDTKLDRKVALKILPAEVASHHDRMRRFVQEAKAVSALNHPNILTIHEIDESDTGHFIATEFIDGETLRERMRKGPLNVSEALDIATQIASALAAAHAAGIVHRDIKPENVMLRSDGIVKVLDFGLAKLTERKTEAVDTEAETKAQVKTKLGMVMGTVGYMSPEQTRGLEIDARSDVWSLGVVLYELLTGKTPFAAETPNDSIAAILTREPAPLDENTPTELQRIIRKSLQKKADERYQTVRDVFLDLKNLKHALEFAAEIERSQFPSPKAASAGAANRSENAAALRSAAAQTQNSLPQPTSSAEYIVTSIRNHKRGASAGSLILLALIGIGLWFFLFRPSGGKQIESIAVLPFVNESGGQDAEYLSDGITETLISSLSQLPNLNVKPRASVFRYKGKEINPQTIGKELNVPAILNGRVVQRGQDLSLFVELIDLALDKVVWSQQYNRKQSDLVSLQSEIARDVSSKLKSKLSGADEQKLAKTYTTNPEAYRLYLQGRFYWNKREEKDLRKAMDYFNQAIALDSNYALAYAGLADSYAILSSYGFMPVSEADPKTLEFARRALSLDDTLAEPHAAIARQLAQHDYDFAGAEDEFKRAMQLNRNYATAHQWYAETLTYLGKFDEAFAEFRRALEIEPLSLPINWDFGRTLYMSRRYDESFTQFKKTVEMDPGFARTHRSFAELYRIRKDYPNAVAESARFFELSGQPQNAVLLRESFAKDGWVGCLRLATAANSPLKENNWLLARAYIELGEKDKAFAELNNAYESRTGVAFLKVEPQLDPLRSDPRFQDLMKKVGLPQ